jgi:hypothetical protein
MEVSTVWKGKDIGEELVRLAGGSGGSGPGKFALRSKQ